jgi:hypothetical protein
MIVPKLRIAVSAFSAMLSGLIVTATFWVSAAPVAPAGNVIEVGEKV